MSNNIKTLLKNMGQLAVGVTGIHGWYLTKTQHKMADVSNQLQLQKEILNQQAQEISTKNLEHYIGKTELKNKSVSFHDRAKEILDSIQKSKEDFETNQDIYHLEEVNRGISTFLKESSEYTNYLAEHNSDIISNASNNQVLHEANTTDISPNIELNNTSESSLFGTIQDMIDQLNQFLSGLTLEQYACFVNTIALLIIFSSINAITAIFYGDKFIKYLKLEDKFPKLTKWIEYRRTFQNYFFIYNIILIYVVIFLFTTVNIFMFFM